MFIKIPLSLLCVGQLILGLPCMLIISSMTGQNWFLLYRWVLIAYSFLASDRRPRVLLTLSPETLSSFKLSRSCIYHQCTSSYLHQSLLWFRRLCYSWVIHHAWLLQSLTLFFFFFNKLVNLELRKLMKTSF